MIFVLFIKIKFNELLIWFFNYVCQFKLVLWNATYDLVLSSISSKDIYCGLYLVSWWHRLTCFST